LGDCDIDDDPVDLVFTANGTLVVEDSTNFTISPGSTFTPGGAVTTDPSSSSSSTDGDIRIAGTLSMETNALSVGGDFNNTGTFSKSTGQTTTFTATSTGHVITDGGENFDTIVFNGASGGWSFADSTTVDVDMTITNGELSGSSALVITGDLALASGGTMSGTASVTVNGGGVTGDGTINLTSGTFIVNTAGNFGGNTAWTFSTLTIGGAGNAITTSTGTGAITVSTLLTIDTEDTLDAKGRTWTLSGTSGTVLTISGTLNDSTDTSTFNFTGANGAGDTTIPTSTAYHNVTTNASDTFNFAGTSTMTGTLTVTSGTVATSGTLNMGYINIGASGVLSAGSATLNVTGTTGTLLTRAGTFTAGTSTVDLAGDGTATVNSGAFTGANAFATLISSGTGTKTLGAAITSTTSLEISDGTFSTSGTNYAVIANDVTIGALGTFTANDSSITVTDDWTDSGTFTAGTSLVTFNTASDAYITGDVDFYDLTLTHTAAKTVYFSTAHIVKILSGGLFTVDGSLGNIISLKSHTAGVPASPTQWNIDHLGTEAVDYAYVEDSNCEATATTISTTDSTGSNYDTCWDFPVAGITVSGNAYANDKTTAITAKTVHLRVNGTLAGTGSGGSGIEDTIAGGAFEFTGVSASVGDTITLYLDGETETANTITITDGSTNITDIKLYDDHLVLKSDNGATAITNADLADWDHGDDNDDLEFTADGGTLVVEDGTKLLITTGDTYTPGGAVTTDPSASAAGLDGDIEIDGTGIMTMGTNALSVGGDFLNEGTFNKSTGQTTTFTATATGHSITDGGESFDTLVFNGVSGGWSIADGIAVDVNFTLTNGTFDPNTFLVTGTGTNTLSVASGGTLNVDASTFAGNYTSFETITLNSGSTVNYELAGTQTVDETLAYSNLKASTSGTKSLNGTTTATGTTTITGATLDTTSANDYTLNTAYLDIATGGTLIANDSTIAIGSDWTNDGTFNYGTSTISFTTNNNSIIDGNTEFYNLNISSTTAKTMTFTAGDTTTINSAGVFTVAGNTGQLIKLWSSSTPTQWIINHQGTESVDYADVKDSDCHASSTNITTTNTTGSGQNNDTCWIFGQPTLTFSLGANSINLGTLTSVTTGSGSHTFSAATNATGGFAVYVNGATLTTAVSDTISAIGASAAASDDGTEQFGINLRDNTAPDVAGDEDVVTNSGTCGYGSGFGTTDQFKFVAGSDNTLTAVTAAADCIYTASYIGNITPLTDAGAYSTTLTYTVVGTF